MSTFDWVTIYLRLLRYSTACIRTKDIGLRAFFVMERDIIKRKLGI